MAAITASPFSGKFVLFPLQDLQPQSPQQEWLEMTISHHTSQTVHN